MHRFFGHRALLVMLLSLSVFGLVGTAACVASSGNDSDDAHYIKGREFQDQNHLEEAIAEFDEAIRLHPSSLEAFTGRGDAYYSMGQMRQALEDYDQAIRLRFSVESRLGIAGHDSEKSALAGAYVGLALIQTGRGDDMEAQRSLAEVVRIGADAAEARTAIELIKAQR